MHRTTILEKGCFYRSLHYYKLLPIYIRNNKFYFAFKRYVRNKQINAELYTIGDINEKF